MKKYFSELDTLFCSDIGTFLSMVEIRDQMLVILDEAKLHQFLHTSPKKFLLSKDYFERNCTTMLEYLRWYNLLDCHLLAESIRRYADGFLEVWKINIHRFKSVSEIDILFNYLIHLIT